MTGLSKPAVKRVLLLNPPGDRLYARDKFCTSVSKTNYYWPPVDLLALSGRLAKRFKVGVMDAIVERLGEDACLDRAKQGGYDAVIFLTCAASWRQDFAFAARLKEELGLTLLFISHDLKVIENCALSAGTEYKGRRIGSWGDLGAFSLQIVKVITAGEGGVVTSSDPDLYERAVRFHDQGNYRESSRFPGITPHLDPFAGESYRMTELAGASALRQLEKLDAITGTLRARYRRFREGIASIDGLVPQPVNDEDGHLGVRYGLLFDDVETCKRFSDAVREEGLSMGLLYGGRPVYLLPQILNQTTVTPSASPWKSPLYDGEVTYHEGLCARSEETMKRVLQIARINCLYSERDVDEMVSILRRVAKAVL